LKQNNYDKSVGTILLFVFHLVWDGSLFIIVVAHVLHVLTTTALVLDPRVIVFGPVLAVQHMHSAKDHHYTHYKHHNSDDDFTSLVAHVTPFLNGSI
jgi:hypothetical protein